MVVGFSVSDVVWLKHFYSASGIRYIDEPKPRAELWDQDVHALRPDYGNYMEPSVFRGCTRLSKMCKALTREE
jgi:hypothetical protein